MLLVVFEGALEVAGGKLGVVGQQGVEGQLEEAVDGLPSGVDGCNARGRQDDVFLFRVGTDVAQECAFARSRLSGQEDALMGVTYQAQRILELRA